MTGHKPKGDYHYRDAYPSSYGYKEECYTHSYDYDNDYDYDYDYDYEEPKYEAPKYEAPKYEEPKDDGYTSLFSSYEKPRYDYTEPQYPRGMGLVAPVGCNKCEAPKPACD